MIEEGFIEAGIPLQAKEVEGHRIKNYVKQYGASGLVPKTFQI